MCTNVMFNSVISYVKLETQSKMKGRVIIAQNFYFDKDKCNVVNVSWVSILEIK